MLITIGTIYFVYILLKIYIATMEVGYVSKAKHDTPVILTLKNYVKAADYKISKERMGMLATLLDYAMFIFWITFGLKWLSEAIMIEDMALKSVVFILAFAAINYLIALPFEIYDTFVIEKKYGFSNITPKLFIQDALKGALLFLLFGAAITWVIAKIILSIETWWLWGFVFIFALVLAINILYPTVIAPMFNKFSLLKDESLQSAITELLKKAGLKTQGVYTIDASKRSSKLNAYFGGLGKSKRVVLYDTLIEKLNTSELLAVLGHELGHFKHKDILKNIAMTGMLLLFMFAIFGNLPQGLFDALQIEKAPYSILALFLLLSPVISFFYMPIMGMVSRHNEYHADEYGAACESAPVLADALQKLANENKSFPKAHPLNIFFYYTHPPLVERLKRLGLDIKQGEDDSLKESCAAS